MSIGKNIARLRKEKGLTQAELGDLLGISNQAISKWENEITMPDVTILPLIADTFGCYIDELFGRIVKAENHFDLCTEFPFPDDLIMREVLCNGRKIIKITPIG